MRDDREMQKFAARHLPNMRESNVAQAEVPTPAVQQSPGPARKICVGLLAYDSKMFCRTSMSLAIAMAKCAEMGFGFTYILREGDSMVARGRSLIASQFLLQEGTKDCTDLILIDTDVYWDGDEFIRLLSHDVDVVAGAYPFKNDAGNFPLRWSSQGLMEEKGLWIVQAVTPGFLRIRRGALERMVRELPYLEFNDHAGGGEKSWMFFDNIARSNGVYDEGYIFCERWRSVGGTVYMDPDMQISHIGQKIFKHGTLRQWMERKSTEVAQLNHEFPNIPPLKLFNKTMGDKTIDLAKEQAEAVAKGDPPIKLEGAQQFLQAAE